MESHYILEGSVNSFSLRELILNFTNNNLSRSFKSITNLKDQSNILIEKEKNKNSSKILLEELNSITFLPTVMKENKVTFSCQLNKYKIKYRIYNIWNNIS